MKVKRVRYPRNPPKLYVKHSIDAGSYKCESLGITGIVQNAIRFFKRNRFRICGSVQGRIMSVSPERNVSTSLDMTLVTPYNGK